MAVTNDTTVQQMNRRQLLDWVTMLGFCADDMVLYLDTHPTDGKALSYYEQCLGLYQNAKKAYEDAYGPLSVASAGARGGVWDWSENTPAWEGVN